MQERAQTEVKWPGAMSEAQAEAWLVALEHKGWGERAGMGRAQVLAQAQAHLELGVDRLAMAPWIAQVGACLHPEALAWLACAALELPGSLSVLAQVAYSRCAARLVWARQRAAPR